MSGGGQKRGRSSSRRGRRDRSRIIGWIQSMRYRSVQMQHSRLKRSAVTKSSSSGGSSSSSMDMRTRVAMRC